MGAAALSFSLSAQPVIKESGWVPMSKGHLALADSTAPATVLSLCFIGMTKSPNHHCILFVSVSMTYTLFAVGVCSPSF